MNRNDKYTTDKPSKFNSSGSGGSGKYRGDEHDDREDYNYYGNKRSHSPSRSRSRSPRLRSDNDKFKSMKKVSVERFELGKMKSKLNIYLDRTRTIRFPQIKKDNIDQVCQVDLRLEQ